MKSDVDRFTNLIRRSPLFLIDKESEPGAYTIEAVKMVGYLYQYLLAVNENKYIDFGLEIFNTANACIKNYNAERGDFLHYFNSAIATNYKRVCAKRVEEEVRGGIVISGEDQRLIRKLLKLAEEKNLEANSDSFCEMASQATGLSVDRVWELIQTNNNASTISEFLTDDEGNELSIFETDAFATFPFNEPGTEVGLKIILDTVEKCFEKRQDRQKPLLSKLITARLSNEIEPSLLPYFKSKLYFDEDTYYRSIEWGVPVSAKEIAAEMNLHESSVSRTAKHFFELLKENIKP